MQLDDIELVGTDPRLLVDLLCRGLRHVEADELAHVVGAERRRHVGRHRLRGDLDIALQPMLLREVLGDQDRRGAAARRRARHEPREHARPERG